MHCMIFDNHTQGLEFYSTRIKLALISLKLFILISSNVKSYYYFSTPYKTYSMYIYTEGIIETQN